MMTSLAMFCFCSHQGTVISSAPSLIEDISVDDDYIAMTKEIALLAPPEEPEENEEPVQIVPKTKPKVESRDQASEKGGKTTDSAEKRSQPKPQREKPPRFDRSGKRKVTSSLDETKREQSSASRARKSSRDNVVSQKPSKGSGVREALFSPTLLINYHSTQTIRNVKHGINEA